MKNGPVFLWYTPDIDSWDKTDLDLKLYNYLIVYTKTCNDAFVLLHAHEDVDSYDAREVVLGGGVAMKIFLRYIFLF